MELFERVTKDIKLLERPHFKMTPGVHTNLRKEVADYSLQGSPSDFDLDREVLFLTKNKSLFLIHQPFKAKLPQLSSKKDLEEKIQARPVTSKFHPDKGKKFDVETPYEKRYPHVADRLGHPEIFPRPWQSLFQVEHHD